MKLQTFRSEPVKTAFEWNGETLNLAVDADVLTGKFLRGMEELADAGESDTPLSNARRSVEFMGQTLAGCVKEWDLTDDDGGPVPISLDTFNTLPQAVVSRLFTHVLQVNVPKAPTAGTSADGL